MIFLALTLLDVKAKWVVSIAGGVYSYGLVAAWMCSLRVGRLAGMAGLLPVRWNRLAWEHYRTDWRCFLSADLLVAGIVVAGMRIPLYPGPAVALLIFLARVYGYCCAWHCSLERTGLKPLAVLWLFVSCLAGGLAGGALFSMTFLLDPRLSSADQMAVVTVLFVFFYLDNFLLSLVVGFVPWGRNRWNVLTPSEFAPGISHN